MEQQRESDSKSRHRARLGVRGQADGEGSCSWLAGWATVFAKLSEAPPCLGEGVRLAKVKQSGV